MLERSQSLLQYYDNIASLQDWYSTDHGSHTTLLNESGEAYDASCCNPDVDRPDVIKREENQEHRNRQFSTLIVNIETDVPAE